MKKECVCCGKEIETMASQIYCGRCKLYTLSLRKEIGNLKYQLKQTKTKLWEYQNGKNNLLSLV